MNQKEYICEFIKNANSFMQVTLKDFLDKNPIYEQYAQDADFAETAYIEISSNLSKEYREIIDDWMGEKRYS